MNRPSRVDPTWVSPLPVPVRDWRSTIGALVCSAAFPGTMSTPSGARSWRGSPRATGSVDWRATNEGDTHGAGLAVVWTEGPDHARKCARGGGYGNCHRASPDSGRHCLELRRRDGTEGDDRDGRAPLVGGREHPGHQRHQGPDGRLAKGCRRLEGVARTPSAAPASKPSATISCRSPTGPAPTSPIR